MMIIYISLDRRKSQTAICIYFFTSNIRTIGCTHQDKRMNAWSASKHLQKAVMVSSMPDTHRRQVICNENLFHVWIGVAYLDQENTWYTLTWVIQVTWTVIILFPCWSSQWTECWSSQWTGWQRIQLHGCVTGETRESQSFRLLDYRSLERVSWTLVILIIRLSIPEKSIMWSGMWHLVLV